MKAVLLKAGPSGKAPTAKVSEVPLPRLRPGELLVEMKACGLCGTDMEKMRGEYTAAMPVLGHEAVGVVDRVEGVVKGIRKGDRVFPHHHVGCLECYYCKRGNQTMCDRYKTSNLDPGGFAEFIRVPSWNVSHGGVLKLPQNLGLEEASMIEPLACCLRAIDRCGVEEGDTVLVAGAGPVGMTHAMVLAAKGAKVLVSDISGARLSFARDSGLGRVIDAQKTDVAQEVRQQSEGRGADVAIVATGSLRAIDQALKSVRKGGRVCIFGVPPKGSILQYDVSDPYNSEVSIFSSYAATDSDTARAAKLLVSRKVDFRSLITHRFHIEEFHKAVETMASGRGMKVVITP